MEIKHAIFEAEVKAGDRSDLTIEHFISTEREDRGHDIMRADGMKIVGKPVVLFAHGRGPMGTEPIAKPVWLKKSEFKGKKGIMAKTQFYPDELGKRLHDKAMNGYMPNWSIGYRVLKDSFIEGGITREVLEWELLEYSPVGVPMNPDAHGPVPPKSADLSLMFKMLPSEQVDELKKPGLGQKVYMLEDDAWFQTNDGNKTPATIKVYVPGQAERPEPVKIALRLAKGKRSEEGERNHSKACDTSQNSGNEGGFIGANGEVMTRLWQMAKDGGLPEKHKALAQAVESVRNWLDGKGEISEAGLGLLHEGLVIDEDDLKDAELWNLEEKPYPNEHACRLADPKQFDSIRRQNDRFGKGIHAIWGIKNEKTTLQAIRFSLEQFTEAQAKKWLSDHEYKCMTFEPAAGKGDSDIEEKGAIAYKKTPLAPEATAWDGPAEVTNADVKAMKIMCVWVDGEKPDLKTSYKGPHHKADGDHACVWNGVRGVSAVIMGARGGIQIQASDMDGVKRHIAGHYKDFGKGDPPWVKKEGKIFQVITEDKNLSDQALSVVAKSYLPDLAEFFEEKLEMPADGYMVVQPDLQSKHDGELRKWWTEKVKEAEDPQSLYDEHSFTAEDGTEYTVIYRKWHEEKEEPASDDKTDQDVRFERLESKLDTFMNKVDALARLMAADDRGSAAGEGAGKKQDPEDNHPANGRRPLKLVLRGDDKSKGEVVRFMLRKALGERLEDEINKMKGKVP